MDSQCDWSDSRLSLLRHKLITFKTLCGPILLPFHIPWKFLSIQLKSHFLVSRVKKKTIVLTSSHFLAPCFPASVLLIRHMVASSMSLQASLATTIQRCQYFTNDFAYVQWCVFLLENKYYCYYISNPVPGLWPSLLTCLCQSGS